MLSIFPEHKELIALISDRTVDFTPSDFDAPLSLEQQEYLFKTKGRRITDLFWRKQVHGNLVLNAQNSVLTCHGQPDADAFITNELNLPIAIRTADCVPIFFYDQTKNAMGLAHAGWKGTQQEIAVRTLFAMREAFGSQAADIKVAIGPCIRRCCYEVGAEFNSHFPGQVDQVNGRYYLDLVAINRAQLSNAGIPNENINETGSCTVCDQNYFSYRREGQKAGRMVSLMMRI